MNYLDLLPNDVMKIINRKVEDLRIISRRNERNKNREINIQQKITADRKRRISNKYALLYHLYKKEMAGTATNTRAKGNLSSIPSSIFLPFIFKK